MNRSATLFFVALGISAVASIGWSPEEHSSSTDTRPTKLHGGQAVSIQPSIRAVVERAPTPATNHPESTSDARSTAGLLALYDFEETEGNVVHDRSEFGRPLNLTIRQPENVRWQDGRLEIVGDTLVASDRNATKITEWVRQTGEITIEAWIQPARIDQAGPARIVSISKNSSARNITLGQDGQRFDVRLRCSTTGTNGVPSLPATEQSVSTEMTHVVYTRDRNGRTRIYVNGEVDTEQQNVATTTSWEEAERLALANEHSGDRAFHGSFAMVAIYGRDLLPLEVETHYRAGPDAPATKQTVSGSSGGENQRLFESTIVPLLIDRCFECHDGSTAEGELNLSSLESAMRGGESGEPLLGDLDESAFWYHIDTDSMPLEREPLSADEKNAVRQWIEGGADWTIDIIDPHIHARFEESSPQWVRRLTIREYVRTVRDTVGVDLSQEAQELLPPDIRADGFSNTAYNLNIDLAHIEAFAELAAIAASRMDIASFAEKWSPCSDLSDDCMRRMVESVGRFLLRGPLEEPEVIHFLDVATTVANNGGEFNEVVSIVVEAMLQSPRFVYRIENQRGDGDVWPIGDYELASRLSYLIWGSAPDEALLQSVVQGEFYDRSQLTEHIDRMLADPRAIERSLDFVEEWLDLPRLEHLRPNSERFPDWDENLAADMRLETRAFFYDVVWNQQSSLSELMNSQFTYLTPELAKHYGIVDAASNEATPATLKYSEFADKDLAYYDLSDHSSRGGLLTHASILTVGGDEASMVSRGLFVLHDVLRGVVKDPPPCVDATPVPTEPGLTQRGIAESRIADASCGGCHSKFEPFAFGLEKFDGIGAYHEADEYGNRLREDGELLFPNELDVLTYETTSQLMNILADHPRVAETITWKMVQFAIGRPLIASDLPIVAKINQQTIEAGGSYQSLIKAIAASDLVLTTKTELIE